MKTLLMLVAISTILHAIPSIGKAQTEVSEHNDLHNWLMVEGLYTRTLGELASTFPHANGGYVSYGMFFPENIMGIAKVGYSNYALNEAATAGQTLSAIHFMAGPRYYFITDGIMPFMGLNVGMNIVTEKITQPDFSSDRTSAQFAWQLTFGATIPIAGNIGLDANLSYNSHFLYHEGSTQGVSGRGNMTGFEYGLGLYYTLE